MFATSTFCCLVLKCKNPLSRVEKLLAIVFESFCRRLCKLCPEGGRCLGKLFTFVSEGGLSFSKCGAIDFELGQLRCCRGSIS